MTLPEKMVMMLLSSLGGGLLAFAMLSIFGIEVSSLERIQNFPDGWTIREFIFNATAVMLLAGASRAIYKGLQEYRNPGQNDGPTSGVHD